MYILYRIKIILKQKAQIFWSLAFPVILGLIFYFMFGNMAEKEMFYEIPIGVCGEENEEGFLSMLGNAQAGDGVKMFRVTEYKGKDEAMEALKKEEIDGFVDMDDNLKLTVKKSGVGASVIRTFLNQYKQNTKLFENIGKSSPDKIEKAANAMLEEKEINIKEISLKGTDKSMYTQFFYAIIAMACLIGSMVGLNNGNDIQADLSMVAARRNVAPEKKIKQVLYDFAAAFIIYCILMGIVLFIFIFVYRQDFGEDAGLILLGSCIGSFTGISAGTMIGVFIKGPVQKKEGICTAFFMTSSFLGGLQWGNITYMLEKNCPIINRINPATLIVNAFKSLAVFGDYKQYAVNLASLFAIGLLCFGASILKMRRTKYASI